MTKEQALALLELLADLYRIANTPETATEPADGVSTETKVKV